jgi:hypothetical protein
VFEPTQSPPERLSTVHLFCVESESQNSGVKEQGLGL